MRVIYILYTIFNIGGKIAGVEARPLSCHVRQWASLPTFSPISPRLKEPTSGRWPSENGSRT